MKSGTLRVQAAIVPAIAIALTYAHVHLAFALCSGLFGRSGTLTDLPFRKGVVRHANAESRAKMTGIVGELEAKGVEGWKSLARVRDATKDPKDALALDDVTRAFFDAYWENPSEANLHRALTASSLTGAFRDYREFLSDEQVESFGQPRALVSGSGAESKLHPFVEAQLSSRNHLSRSPDVEGFPFRDAAQERFITSLSRYPDHLKVFWIIPLTEHQVQKPRHSLQRALGICHRSAPFGVFFKYFMRNVTLDPTTGAASKWATAELGDWMFKEGHPHYLIIYPSIFYQAVLDAAYPNRAVRLVHTIYKPSTDQILEGLKRDERTLQFSHPDLEDSIYRADPDIRFGRYLFTAHDFNHAAWASTLEPSERAFRANAGEGLNRYLKVLEEPPPGDPLGTFLRSPMFLDLGVKLPNREEIERILHDISDIVPADSSEANYRGLFKGRVIQESRRSVWVGPVELVAITALTMPNRRDFLDDFLGWYRRSQVLEKTRVDQAAALLDRLMSAWEAHLSTVTN